LVISFITTSLLGSAPPPSCRKTHQLMDPTKGMAAVAARIRERALALRSSRAELETARIEMARIESEASAEVSKNSSCRAVLLQSLQSRNATELDALRADDASSALEDEIRRLRAETTGILELVRARRLRWAKFEAGVCARHVVEVGMIKLAADAMVGRWEGSQRRRESYLDQLSQSAEALRDEADSMADEEGRLRESMEKMDKEEGRDDEEMTALDMQIRTILRKKTSLRAALREAKDRHLEANEYMLSMEREMSRYIDSGC